MKAEKVERLYSFPLNEIRARDDKSICGKRRHTWWLVAYSVVETVVC